MDDVFLSQVAEVQEGLGRWAEHIDSWLSRHAIADLQSQGRLGPELLAHRDWLLDASKPSAKGAGCATLAASQISLRRELQNLSLPAAGWAMFSLFVRDIAAASMGYATPIQQRIEAQPAAGDRWRYGLQLDEQRIYAYADACGRLELRAWGIAVQLEGMDPQFHFDALAEAYQRWVTGELRAALRVAKRRFRSFAKRGGASRFHAAGEAQRRQAAGLESALVLCLADENYAYRRSDLATDWLEQIDLWRFVPGRSPKKGAPGQVSTTLDPKRWQKKTEDAQGRGAWLWGPLGLAEAMLQGLDDPQCAAALAEICRGPGQIKAKDLGGPGTRQVAGAVADVSDLGRAIHFRFEAAARPKPGRHPLYDLGGDFVLWLRALASSPRAGRGD